MRRKETITQEIIEQVRKLTKETQGDVRRELMVSEPNFYKWIRNSVADDIRNITGSHIQIMSEEAATNLGGILAKAKLDGFLMGMMAQDAVFRDKFFLQSNDEVIPYSRPLRAILDGYHDEKFYAELKSGMTEEETADSLNWKNVALQNFERVKLENKVAPEITKYMEKRQQGGASATAINLQP